MSLPELQGCLDGGRIDMTVLRNELSARLADPTTAAASVTRIGAMLQALPTSTTTSLGSPVDKKSTAPAADAGHMGPLA